MTVISRASLFDCNYNKRMIKGKFFNYNKIAYEKTKICEFLVRMKSPSYFNDLNSETELSEQHPSKTRVGALEVSNFKGVFIQGRFLSISR